MSGASSGLVAAGLFLGAAACAPRALEPGEHPITGGLPGSLAALAGPDTRLIVGSNGGAVIDDGRGRVTTFEQDPGALVAAAATVAIPTCSVELRRLVTAWQAGGPDAISIDEAVADCDGFDFGFVFDQLAASKTPASRVIIGANTAVRMGGTDRGFGYYYDEDSVRLLRAARRLYIPACIVLPDALALGRFPGNLDPGLTVEEALARCGP
jgi:hypothetical protein